MSLKARPITIYCSKPLYDWIHKLAEQDCRSKSGWISRKLEQAMQKQQMKEPPHE
jgi:hypothetical protein